MTEASRSIGSWASRSGVQYVWSSLTTLLLVGWLLGTARDGDPLLVQTGIRTWLAAASLAGAGALGIAGWLAVGIRPVLLPGAFAIAASVLVPYAAGWEWLPRSVQAGAIVVSPLAVAGIVHLMLAERGSRSALPSVYALTAGASVALAVGFDPFADPACRWTCVDVQPLLGDVISTRGAVAASTLLVLAAVATGLAAARGEATPRGLSWAAAASLPVLAMGWVAHAVWWDDPVAPAVFQVSIAWAAMVTGATTLATVVGARGSRKELKRLVDHLSAPERFVQVGSGPIRSVEFAVPGEERWIDAAGQPVPARSGDSVVVFGAGSPSFRLRLSSDASAAEVGRALTPSNRLALRTAQLAALTRARMSEVMTSRRRIVAVADGERQRIERDLHDGAQQRLVSALFHLSLAEHHTTDRHAKLAQADRTIRTALDELRALSRGIFPRVLASEGLAAALRELARTSDMAVSATVSDIDAGPEASAALYAVAATVLERAAEAGTQSAWLRAGRDGSDVVVAVEAEGPGAADASWEELRDRIGSVSGELRVVPAGDHVVVEGRIPCGS